MLNLTTPQLIAQGITVVIIILLVIAGQQKKQERLIFIHTVTNSLYALQFALLSAVTAVIICVVCVARNIIFYRYKKRDAEVPFWVMLSVLAVVIGAGLLSWQNWFSIIPILGTVLYTVGYCHKNIRVTRFAIITADCMWIVYKIVYLAIVSISVSAAHIVSMASAMYRERKKAEQQD